MVLLAGAPTRAADYNRTYQLVSIAYDVGAYTAEVDRLIHEAESRGVFGGRGSTAARRAQDRDLTRQTLLGQRDVVLRETSDKVAAGATDAQIDEVLSMAGPGAASVDQARVMATVAMIKARFNDAAWFQMTRTARGNAEFLCLKGDKTFCP